MTRLTTAEKEMYREFIESFPFCWCCGWHPWKWDHGKRDWMLGRLENAHILGGPMRKTDRRAIVRLCNGCHRAQSGETIRLPKSVCAAGVLPRITLENMLWLKRRFDPEYYDRKYLESIAIRATMPRARQPHAWYRRQNQELTT